MGNASSKPVSKCLEDEKIDLELGCGTESVLASESKFTRTHNHDFTGASGSSSCVNISSNDRMRGANFPDPLPGQVSGDDGAAISGSHFDVSWNYFFTESNMHSSAENSSQNCPVAPFSPGQRKRSDYSEGNSNQGLRTVTTGSQGLRTTSSAIPQTIVDELVPRLQAEVHRLSGQFWDQIGLEHVVFREIQSEDMDECVRMHTEWFPLTYDEKFYQYTACKFFFYQHTIRMTRRVGSLDFTVVGSGC